MSEWVVLVNPTAGSQPASEARITDALDRYSIRHIIERVDGPERMRAAVTEVTRSGRRLAVVGGDGTVGLAAGAIIDSGLGDAPPLGILPAGTGCDLLRTFGIPQRIEDAAAHLVGDGEYRIDAGVIEGEWGRRVFVNVTQAGVGAAAAESAPAVPRRLGSVRYPMAFAARLPRFPHSEVSITGDRTHTCLLYALIIANGQFFAGGWNVAPKAMLVDGKMDVQVIDADKRQVFELVPKVIKGVHLGHSAVRRFSAASLEITTSVPWPVEADGDHLGSTPARVSTLPAAISIKI